MDIDCPPHALILSIADITLIMTRIVRAVNIIDGKDTIRAHMLSMVDG